MAHRFPHGRPFRVSMGAALLALLLLPAAGAGAHGVSVFGGRGNSDFRALRGAVQWQGPLDGFNGKLGIADSHLEAAYARWRSVSVEATDFAPRRGYREVRVLSLAPVWRWVLPGVGGAGFAFYGEYGVGIAHLSSVELEDQRGEQRHLGSPWEFESRVSLGIRALPGGGDVNLRFMHVSNANLAAKNDGIDVLGVTVGFWF